MGGDLVAVSPEGQPLVDIFSIECKDRSDYGQIEGFLRGKGQVWKWWGQCVHDAEVSHRQPMMIFKGSRTPVYIAYPTRLIDEIFVDYPDRLIKQERYLPDVAIALFDDWLQCYDPEVLLNPDSWGT